MKPCIMAQVLVEVLLKSVVSDLLDIARHTQNSPMLGFIKPLEKSGLTLMHRDDICTQYYIRVTVADKIGVLSKISEIFRQKDPISISSFLQKQDKQRNRKCSAVFSTHTCKKRAHSKALQELSETEFPVELKPAMIRIEVK